MSAKLPSGVCRKQVILGRSCHRGPHETCLQRVRTGGRHEPRDGPTVLGDLYLVSAFNIVEKGEDLCLGLGSGQFSGHMTSIVI